jgi:hypothetical protein
MSSSAEPPTAPELLPPSPAVLEPGAELPTPPPTPAPDSSHATPPAAAEAPASASEEELIPHLRVEVPENTTGNGWEQLTQFIQTFTGHMETFVWPKDPFADIYPTMLPFVYCPPDGKQDERFLKELLYLLTIGLQGQAFGWRYKMLFDVHWNETRNGYMAEITSIQRVGAGHFPKPASEATLTEPRET